MTATVVLGMHRSGTSCLAGMLAAAGVASAGEALRNWDNARGHHERLELVRLDEAVLAYSGGSYFTPPTEVRWTADHAAARDALLRDPGILLKDPRMLLVLPFWRASELPWKAIGVVRHPLAVARSLLAWREVALVDGVALWLAHNRVLAAHRPDPVIDFDRPKAHVVAELAAATGADPDRLASGYLEELVHHDDGDPPAIAGLSEAIALYRELGGQGGARAFPRSELEAFTVALAAGDLPLALASALGALSKTADPAAVLVPAITALLRARAFAEVSRLLSAAPRGDDGLVDLLAGKYLLAMRDPVGALRVLEAACAVERPLYQARALLPHALRGAGEHDRARALLEDLAGQALYPHGPLATLAEWSAVDGDRAGAIAQMARAIDAAPPQRRGRLRCRRAEWLQNLGRVVEARAELETALVEDPGYARTSVLLAGLRAPRERPP